MSLISGKRIGLWDSGEVNVFALDSARPAPRKVNAKSHDVEVTECDVPPEVADANKWPKPLTVVGNRLHDSDGNDVWLQGVNAGGLEVQAGDPQPIRSAVVAIDKWLSNCVRVPVKETFWYGQGEGQTDGGARYREMIDQIITLAANRGAYVAIDLHRFRAPKQEHAEFWKDFATLYKDHPAVLFDLFNEPHDISWEVWRNGGFVGDKKGVDESAFLNDADKMKNQGFESVGMQGLAEYDRSRTEAEDRGESSTCR